MGAQARRHRRRLRWKANCPVGARMSRCRHCADQVASGDALWLPPSDRRRLAAAAASLDESRAAEQPA